MTCKEKDTKSAFRFSAYSLCSMFGVVHIPCLLNEQLYQCPILVC